MKPEKWIREDLQAQYDDLTAKQQPLLRKHRELCEKIRKHKAETGQHDATSLSELREGNKKLADLESQKQKLWKENLDYFHSLSNK